MDMSETSAMTEASGLTEDQLEGRRGTRDGAEQAPRRARQARSDFDTENVAASLSGQLRRVTTEAPLQSLALAFLLGVLFARRR